MRVKTRIREAEITGRALTARFDRCALPHVQEAGRQTLHPGGAKEDPERQERRKAHQISCDRRDISFNRSDTEMIGPGHHGFPRASAVHEGSGAGIIITGLSQDDIMENDRDRLPAC